MGSVLIPARNERWVEERPNETRITRAIVDHCFFKLSLTKKGNFSEEGLEKLGELIGVPADFIFNDCGSMIGLSGDSHIMMSQNSKSGVVYVDAFCCWPNSGIKLPTEEELQAYGARLFETPERNKPKISRSESFRIGTSGLIELFGIDRKNLEDQTVIRKKMSEFLETILKKEQKTNGYQIRPSLIHFKETGWSGIHSVELRKEKIMMPYHSFSETGFHDFPSLIAGFYGNSERELRDGANFLKKSFEAKACRMYISQRN